MSESTAAKSTNKKNIRGILISSLIFIVVVVGMLITNIVVSDALQEDSSEINLAGRQRMLSQRMTKSMVTLLRAINDQNMTLASIAQNELNESSQLFESTLNVFRDGGSTTGARGEAVLLRKIQDPALIVHADQAHSIWQTLRPGISYLSTQDVSSIDADRANATMNELNTNNLELLNLMNMLTVGLETEAESKSKTLKWALSIALAIVIANFTYLIFYIVRRI